MQNCLMNVIVIFYRHRFMRMFANHDAFKEDDRRLIENSLIINLASSCYCSKKNMGALFVILMLLKGALMLSVCVCCLKGALCVILMLFEVPSICYPLHCFKGAFLSYPLYKGNS